MIQPRSLSLLLIPFAFVINATVLAADKPLVKVIDLRLDRTKATGLALVFCAREKSIATRSPGHAFVVWAREDSARQLTKIDAFGQHPDIWPRVIALTTLMDRVWAPGTIKEEEATRADVLLIAHVDKANSTRLIGFGLGGWRQKVPYRLFETDSRTL